MTTVPPSLTICGDGGDRLEITLMYRAHGEVADFDDGNWLEAAVKIQAGGFFGNAAVTLRAEEFRAFRNQVRELYRVLSGRAVFTTMEEWMEVALVGDGRGHIEAVGFVRDDLDSGNRLEFRFSFDQTRLQPIMRALDGIESEFPVVGSPPA